MSHQGLPHITCEHLLKLHGSDKREHVVLDLRDALEFESGHIKDSLNIPKRELATNIGNLLPDKEKRVIVIVGPTQEPDLAAIGEELKTLGYKNIEFLAGGFDQWCEIAPLEIEPDLLEQTPEEAGITGHEPGEEPLDPHIEEDEPIL
ncbi:MAG TPA: rhodanese-like domain-containing protein [Candidatus Binatia bacterium]|jgi:rhodanese-related sulfurtransferase|nr:rhodanese-like domain-containing protein [Candidatus Binatia bacterium]